MFPFCSVAAVCQVTWQKVNIIRSTPQLASLVDNDAALQQGCKDGRLITRGVSILPVDLRDLKSVDDALSAAQFDDKCSTVLAWVTESPVGQIADHDCG